MMLDTDQSHVSTERSREATFTWGALLLHLSRASNHFAKAGDAIEAGKVEWLKSCVAKMAQMHLDKIKSANGHSQDSTTAEAYTPAPTPNENRPALADETGASDGGRGNAEPLAAAPNFAEQIDVKLSDVRALAQEHPGGQAWGVAESFLCRARNHLAGGKEELARRQWNAAMTVLNGGRELDERVAAE